MSDSAEARAARARGRVRYRVCRSCVTTADFVFGGVHSELACDRCGAKPCVGAIVGDSPTSGTQPLKFNPGVY